MALIIPEWRQTEFTSAVTHQLDGWICYCSVYHSRFPDPWICGHMQHDAPRQHVSEHTTWTHQWSCRNTSAGSHFDSCLVLYFSHQTQNTTLNHSLKSTKVNYPSFSWVPVRQESLVYLDPDVSMSQSGDSRPQRELLSSLWVQCFAGVSTQQDAASAADIDTVTPCKHSQRSL